MWYSSIIALFAIYQSNREMARMTSAIFADRADSIVQPKIDKTSN